MMQNMYAIIFILIAFCVANWVCKRLILPKLIEIDTKEVEKNPKWIMKDVKNSYYGFQDIDIILIESNLFRPIPRFRITKDKTFEFLIPKETSTKNVDEVLRLALMSKIQIKYGLMYEDKPLYWLSILCFLLDGGDITEVAPPSKKEKIKQETS